MEFFRRAQERPASLGVFSGSFNPPTRAHMALAQASLALVEEVLFILPRVFPHKDYEGADFSQRVNMLLAATAGDRRYSVGATESGLFIDIARDCRTDYGATVDLKFLCGRDAAERVVNWDYGRAGAFSEMLEEFELLVAPRSGEYKPPSLIGNRIHVLPLEENYEEYSATEVRQRIKRGDPWEQLVPEEIVGIVRDTYLKLG